MKTISFQSDILPLKNELFRMALRITQNREEAEDVVQETMIKVWNRREQWAQLESIEAFCLTICRNLALDKLRRMDNQVQSLGDDIDPTDHSHGSNPEQVTMPPFSTLLNSRLRLIFSVPVRLSGNNI